MILRDYQHNALVEFNPTADSVLHKELMKSDYIRVKFNLANPVILHRGTYVDKYILKEDYKPKWNKSTGGYEYDVQLDAWYYFWNGRILTLNPEYGAQETSFSLTDTLDGFWRVILRCLREYNLNVYSGNPPYTYKEYMSVSGRTEEGYERMLADNDCLEVNCVIDWSTDAEDGKPEHKAKGISFEAVKITDAISLLCKEDNFNCEWWFEGRTLHFGHCERESDLVWNLGEQVEEMQRGDSQDEFCTRLIAFGSNKNIPLRYRKKLVLTATSTTGEDSARPMKACFFKSAKRVKPADKTNNSGYEHGAFVNGNIFSSFRINEYQQCTLNVGRLTLTKPIPTNWNQVSSTILNLLRETTIRIEFYDSSGNLIQYEDGTENYYIDILPSVTASRDQNNLIFYMDYEEFDNFFTPLNSYRCVVHLNGFTNDALYSDMSMAISASWRFSDYLVQTHIKPLTGSRRGQVISAVINPDSCCVTSLRSAVYDNVTLGVGDMYMFCDDTGDVKNSDVLSGQVPVGYFTDDFATDISNYERRLMLPIDLYPYNYIDSEDIYSDGEVNYADQSHLIESRVVELVKVYDDIYPSKTLTIKDVYRWTEQEDDPEDESGVSKITVPHYYIFVDSNEFPFDEDFIIDKLECTLQSGLMAGMSFEVKFLKDRHDDLTTQTNVYCYELIINDTYGIDLPNDVLKPATGDTLVFVGYDPSMLLTGDEGIVATAEKKLAAEAIKTLNKVKKDSGRYTCPLMSSYAKGLYEGDGLPVLGDKVRVINLGYFSTYRDSRIIGIEQKLDYPWDTPKYIVGESGAYSRSEETAKSISALTSKITYSGSGSGSGSVNPSDIRELIKEYGKEYYLSKLDDDTANGKITFKKGLVSSGSATFNSFATFNGEVDINNDVDFGYSLIRGIEGAGIYKENGYWHAQFDYLHVNKKLTASEVEIDKISHVGGAIVLSATRCKITRTEPLENEKLRCYFTAEDEDGNSISNNWMVGDQALVQTFNLTDSNGQMSNHFWWRLVDAVGTSGNEHYIDFDVTEDAGMIGDTYAEGSDIPLVGDEVVLCGSRAVNQPNRQNVIFLDSAGEGSPYMRIYKGVGSGNNPFSLSDDKLKIDLNAEDSKLEVGSLKIVANGASKDVGEVLDESFLVWYVENNAPLENGEIISVLQADYAGFPAAENYWEESEYPDHLKDIALTLDGVCYRFEVLNGDYVWKRKSDDFLIQALETSQANAQTLTNMASDSIITKQEKVQLKNWRSQINAEKEQITAEAAAINITDSQGNISHVSSLGYVSAYNALKAFLDYFLASPNADTPLINTSGYTLFATEGASIVGVPNTYTISYVNRSGGIATRGYEYSGAVSRYYTQLNLLRKNITNGVRREFTAASESGIDAQTQAYINDLKEHLAIGEAGEGQVSLTQFSEIYNALSSWEWETTTDPVSQQDILTINGAGIVTTANFASLFASAWEGDTQVARAIVGAFCEKATDEQGHIIYDDHGNPVWVSSVGINATYFVVDTQNFKVTKEGDVSITGTITAKNYVEEFVTIPVLYEKDGSQYSETNSIDLLEFLKGNYYEKISNSEYRKFEAGSCRNFIVNHDLGVNLTHDAEMLLSDYCPNGTCVLFVNTKYYPTGEGDVSAYGLNFSIDDYESEFEPHFQVRYPFIGVSRDADKSSGLTPVPLGKFYFVYQICIGYGLIEFQSVPNDGYCDWIVTRMSAATFRYY